MLLLTAMFLTFSACSKDDDEPNVNNSSYLVNTKYDCYDKYSNSTIEFTSDKDVKCTSSEGVVTNGTYTKNGLSIKFDLSVKTLLSLIKLSDATLSEDGLNMKVNYVNEFDSSSKGVLTFYKVLDK